MSMVVSDCTTLNPNSNALRMALELAPAIVIKSYFSLVPPKELNPLLSCVFLGANFQRGLGTKGFSGRTFPISIHFVLMTTSLRIDLRK